MRSPSSTAQQPRQHHPEASQCLQYLQFPQVLLDEVVYEPRSSRLLAVPAATKATATSTRLSAEGEKQLDKQRPQSSHQQNSHEEKPDNESPEPTKKKGEKKDRRGEKLLTNIRKQLGHETKESRPCRTIAMRTRMRRGCGRWPL